MKPILCRLRGEAHHLAIQCLDRRVQHPQIVSNVQMLAVRRPNPIRCLFCHEAHVPARTIFLALVVPFVDFPLLNEAQRFILFLRLHFKNILFKGLGTCKGGNSKSRPRRLSVKLVHPSLVLLLLLVVLEESAILKLPLAGIGGPYVPVPGNQAPIPTYSSPWAIISRIKSISWPCISPRSNPTIRHIRCRPVLSKGHLPARSDLPAPLGILPQAPSTSKFSQSFVTSRTSPHSCFRSVPINSTPTSSYRSEERRVGKEGRSRWAPYH